MSLRAAVYARFSTDNQKLASIETQNRICREYAKRKGYHVVRYYSDEARTGTTVVGRDGFKLMLAEVNLHIWDVLIVYTLDRTARQELDYYLYKQELLNAGVRYEYATESFDPSTVDGQFFEAIQVGQAAWYSRKTAVKIRDGKETAAEHALFPGGLPPLGYDVANQHYVINEAEAALVRLIFTMYNAGRTYGEIIAVLNAKGARTKTGKLFGKNSIYDLIGNPKYIGRYFFRRHVSTHGHTNSHANNPAAVVYDDAVPAIISKDEWEAAQARKAANRYIGSGHTCDYLLSGMVRCGECGFAMSGNSSHKGKYVYRFYQCVQQKNRGVSACSSSRIGKDELENLVIGKLLNVDFTRLSKIIDAARAEYANLAGNNEKDLAGLTAKLEGLKRRLNNIYAVLETGAADDFDLARMKSIKEEIKAVQGQIDAQRDRPDELLTHDELLEYWQAFRDCVRKKHDPGMIRSVLSDFVYKIEVYRDKVLIQISLSRLRLVALMGIEPMISP